MSRTSGRRWRVGLPMITLGVTSAMTIAMGVAVWAIERQQAEIENKEQRIFDVAVPTVVEDMRKVRILDRLARDGESILWIDDHGERAERRRLLESVVGDAALQDDQPNRTLITVGIALLDTNLADLNEHGKPARARAIERWGRVRSDLLDESERIGTASSTLASAEAESITESAHRARNVVILANAVLASGALVTGILFYLALTLPIVRLAKSLKLAQNGQAITRSSSSIRELQVLYDSATDLASAHRELEATRSQLEQLAHTDELTGLANRRMFEIRGSEEFARSRRQGHSIAVVGFDIDHFKHVNDTYSHDGGDAVLRRLGAVLRLSVRASDVPIARVGGEEFTMLIPTGGLRSACEAAERIRREIEAMEIDLPTGQRLRITASFGVAESSPAESDFHAVLHRADLALYKAKEGGRNRVAVDDGG